MSSWVPNCVPNGEVDATIKCLDVYFFQYSANKEATIIDSLHYNDPSLNGLSDASAVIYATTLLGTEINGKTRKYFVFRETGWDLTSDPYKIIYYDSLNSSSGAVSAAYCSACSDYQFTQLFCMAQDINSVTATGIPTAGTYPSAAGTIDNRLAMAPYYLLYFNNWAKNGTIPILGPGQARISLNPNSCQIPASWVCDNPDGYKGGPFPPRLWSRATDECVDFSTDELNMRRKAEVLQHKKNKSNISSKTQFAELVRGNGPYRKRSWGTQNIDFTNPNVNKLSETNQFTLLCPNKEKLCALTSSSDVPGKIQLLCMDRSIPLTRWIPRRTYGASGNKWPEWKWEPGMNGFPRGKKGNSLIFG